MDLLILIAIFLAIIVGFVVVLPIVIVKSTELDNDKTHPVYITKRYVDEIGWDTASNQELSIFVGWGALVPVVGQQGVSHDIGAEIIFCIISVLAFYWFYRSFKEVFNDSNKWSDNLRLMSALLFMTLAFHAYSIFGTALTLFIGIVISAWWGGRLMMYKALRDHNVYKNIKSRPSGLDRRCASALYVGR